MSSELAESFRQSVADLDAKNPQFAVDFIERLLSAGRRAGVSDIHLHPTGDGIEVRWRIDGVLHLVGAWPSVAARNLVGRLKVLADLLTYRTDVPQEGRVQNAADGIEMRVSTFPTLYGERVVVRIFAECGELRYLSDLAFPREIQASLERLLHETAGAILVTGPSGSGKTTTLYACVRELARRSGGGRSLLSIEDPIETSIPGVSQSQVNDAAGFSLAVGLRSLLRQDPEVILLGEIRDRETAEVAIQAALTGHLLLTSFHAGSAAEAVARLSEMGIEPYMLRSGIKAVLSQRLVRRLCRCARVSTDDVDRLGIPVTQWRTAVGCDECHATGYRGRLALCELLTPSDNDLGRAILSRKDAARLDQLAGDAGMISRWTRASLSIEAGETSPAEVRRVLGFSHWQAP